MTGAETKQRKETEQRRETEQRKETELRRARRPRGAEETEEKRGRGVIEPTEVKGRRGMMRPTRATRMVTRMPTGPMRTERRITMKVEEGVEVTAKAVRVPNGEGAQDAVAAHDQAAVEVQAAAVKAEAGPRIAAAAAAEAQAVDAAQAAALAAAAGAVVTVAATGADHRVVAGAQVTRIGTVTEIGEIENEEIASVSERGSESVTAIEAAAVVDAGLQCPEHLREVAVETGAERPDPDRASVRSLGVGARLPEGALAASTLPEASAGSARRNEVIPKESLKASVLGRLVAGEEQRLPERWHS